MTTMRQLWQSTPKTRQGSLNFAAYETPTTPTNLNLGSMSSASSTGFVSRRE